MNPTLPRQTWMSTAGVVVPLMAATFIDTSCDFVASFFSARHSNGVLCAALPAGALAMTFVSVLLAVVALAGTVFAREHGGGRVERAVAAFHQGLLLALLTLPLFALALPLGGWVLEWFAHEPSVRALERILFRYQLAGGFCLVLFTALSGVFSGQGRTRLISAAAIAACLASALASAVLINGCGPVPALGVHGLGLSILLGEALPCLLLLPALVRDPLARTCLRGNVLKPDRAILLTILRRGIPSGLSVLVLSGAFSVFTLVVGRLNAVSVTAVNICFVLNGFYWVFVEAAEQAVTILVGRALGARDHAGAETAIRQTAGILALPLVLFFTFCLLGSDFVTRLLYDPKSGIDFATLCATVRFVLTVFIVRDLLEAGAHLIGGALTAALDTRALLVIRLGANAVCLAILGVIFAYAPSLAAYVCLTPVQMALVLVPLAIRWWRFRS